MPSTKRSAFPEADALASRVKELRQAKGWTQEKLADAADMDRAYVAGIETARRNPALKNLARIAKALRVGVADLLR